MNVGNILGSVLQSGLRGPSMGRLGHAMEQPGMTPSRGGPLGQILGRLGGSSGATRYGQPGGGDVLGGLAGLGARHLGGGGGGLGRGLMAGGLGALAASVLSGRGRRTGGGVMPRAGGMGGGNMRGAVGAGGLALLGMLAMKALRNGGQQEAAASPDAGASVPDGAATPPAAAVSDRTATVVLKAMVAAAKADGQIDAEERERIAGKLRESGAEEESLAFVQQEMEGPADVEGLVAEARDPVVAAQVYAASLLAIKVDTQGERTYLRDLASRLGLEAGTVQQLHQALGVPAA